MNEPMSIDRRAQIAEHLAAIPAPPWHWIGNCTSGPILVTKHSGWIYVMGFRRLGMHGAQPEFPVRAGDSGFWLTHSAAEQIVPRAPHDPKTFRGIDNDVARFFERSAEYVAELLAENERLRTELAEERQASMAQRGRAS